MKLMNFPRSRRGLAPFGALATILTTLFYDPLHLISFHISAPSSLLSTTQPLPPPSQPAPLYSYQVAPAGAPAAVARSWRDELELLPEHNVANSRTMGFSRIMTIALPGTESTRGMHMDILSDALELDIDRFTGTLSSEPIITWIAERVLVDRLFKNTPGSHPPYPYETPSPQHENLAWPVYLEKYDPKTEPEMFVLSGEYGGEHEIFKQLIEATGKLGELEMFTEQTMRGLIACWHAHMRALLYIERTPGIESALILEDDVDIEFDIKRLWGGISLQLPSTWDMVYLGYVWSSESNTDGLAPIAIRKSSSPLGTMAYAVSKKGARKALDQLRKGSVFTDGPLLGVGPFGQPLDNAFRTLIQMSRLTSYSVSPPLVIHPGFFSSSIGVGTSAWNGTLIDSTIARACKFYDVKGIWSGGCFHAWQHWIGKEGQEVWKSGRRRT